MKENKFVNMIPVRQCDHEINDDLVTVLFVKRPTMVEKLFFRSMINKPYKIDLDEIGSFIWGKINGVINVDEIIDITDKYFGKKVEPAEDRVIQFLKQMHQTKLIMLYEKVVEKE